MHEMQANQNARGLIIKRTEIISIRISKADQAYTHE